MESNNETILENDAVLLRPLKKEDISLLEEFSINEPELWTYSLTPADGLDNLKNYIDQALGIKNYKLLIHLSYWINAQIKLLAPLVFTIIKKNITLSNLVILGIVEIF